MGIHKPIARVPDWIIRVSSSPGMGGGHVKRCLVLAKSLAVESKILFILDTNGASWVSSIEAAGFNATCTPSYNIQKIRGCIIDVRNDAEQFATTWRERADMLAAFSDVTGLPDESDVEIGNLFSKTQTKPTPILLTGPQFALVDPNFYRLGPSNIREMVRNITISFGLHDTRNATRDALLAMKRIEDSTPFKANSILAYLGDKAPHLHDVHQHARAFGGRAQVIVGAASIQDGLKDCDLVLGGGGLGMLERASAGVPSITFSIADNQIENAVGADAANITVYAGDTKHMTLSEFQAAILPIITDKQLRQQIAKTGPQIIDGQGGCRLAAALRSLSSPNQETCLSNNEKLDG